MEHISSSTVFVIILFLTHKVYLTITPTVLLYHRDVSEFCRRQVVPSMFVGRQIRAANSHILHFSKLDMPYTCFISVRTETGNNLILVAEVLSNADLIQTCAKHHNQLLVYEMGETFGGYWGRIPDDLIRKKVPDTNIYYTLKTTAPTPAKILDQDTAVTKDRNRSVTNYTKNTDSTTDRDYITVEIPIVNVSGSLVPEDSLTNDNLDAEDLFEILYDVTPWPSVKYDTSILPLVQFRIDSKKTTNMETYARKISFNPDIQILTLDKRITYPALSYSTVKRIPWKKQKYNANRRLNFKRNRNLFSTKTIQKSKPHGGLYTSILPPLITIKKPSLSIPLKRDKFRQTQNFKFKNTLYTPDFTTIFRGNISRSNESWEVIEHLMKTLNKTENVKQTVPKNVSYLLHKISEMKHNFSAYLAPNLSIYSIISPSGLTFTPLGNYEYINTKNIHTYRPYEVTTIRIKEVLTSELTRKVHEIIEKPATHLNKTTKVYLDKITSPITYTQKENFVALFNNTSVNTYDNSDAVFYNNTVIYSSNTDSEMTSPINYSVLTELEIMTIPTETGSLVGRESWENIVQSAPEMAVLLNETRDNDVVKRAKRKHKKRKKRKIKAIEIDEDKPRKLIRKTTLATSKTTLNMTDMQEFAQLVEQKDDALYDRVAMRNIRQITGPMLYNICDIKDASSRSVFLFNTSRILLFIGNFSMQSMTIILTPARTLMTSDSCCMPTNIECQVSGARVCIDSLVTCDGIPNCGSYDIYDEDRLMCNVSLEMQHNVYLAAFTFLAVMLTIFYVVHYWLKQYVPRVSEAFFIYMNGVENILYLDSIMRNPNEGEDDEISKMVYHGNIYEDDTMYSTEIKTKKKGVLTCLKNLFTCGYLRKKPIIQDDIFFSAFQETELPYFQKKSIDISVQTSDSLEMTHLATLKNNTPNYNDKRLLPITSEVAGITASLSDVILPVESLNDYDNELSMLKFFKISRSDSINSASFDPLTLPKNFSDRPSFATLEKEIVIHEYMHQASDIAGPSTKNEQFVVPSKREVKKHLRFNEETTVIPPLVFGLVDNESNEDNSYRRVVDLGKTSSPSPEFSSGTRRFWSKTKNTKKRPQL